MTSETSVCVSFFRASSCGTSERSVTGSLRRGLVRATEAARAVRAKLAVPHFRDGHPETDFDDLACLEGLQAVSTQLASVRRRSWSEAVCRAERPWRPPDYLTRRPILRVTRFPILVTGVCPASGEKQGADRSQDRTRALGSAKAAASAAGAGFRALRRDVGPVGLVCDPDA